MFRSPALIGTMVLASLMSMSALWAWQVVRTAVPIAPLPQASASIAQPKDATSQPKVSLRPARPAVFYAAITDRPLFSPSRRPDRASTSEEARPSIQVSEADPSPEEAPAFVLRGTMSIGKEWAALISVDEAPADWFQSGVVFKGYTLVAVGPDWAELAAPSQTLKLELYPK